MTYRAISFFTGCMGLDLGIEEAGFTVLSACEVASSYRKPHQSRSKARDTIRANRPYLPIYEGIEAYDAPTEHYDLDLIAGGPPCQSFSTAGLNGGLSDPRGLLLMTYADIVVKMQPKTFILENVKGLVSSKHRSTFDLLIATLTAGGYHIRVNEVNAANFGVAQNRRRVILVGSLTRLPLPMAPTHPIPPTLREQIYHLRLTSKLFNRLSPSVKAALNDPNYLPAKRLEWDGQSNTLMTKTGGNRRSPLAHPDQDRPLSVEEYRVLQGFPEDFLIVGSVRSQHEQLGNAVPVPLGYAAALTAKETL